MISVCSTVGQTSPTELVSPILGEVVCALKLAGHANVANRTVAYFYFADLDILRMTEDLVR